MTLQRTDYENMATEAVSEYFSNSTPLNTSILKIAQEQDFNPNQIKRLVEMANVKTFLKSFNAPDGKGKNIEFDVADPKKIIKNYYDKGSDEGSKRITITKITVSKGGDDFFGDMPDMMRDERHPDISEAPKTEKTASVKPNKEAVIMGLRKVAEDMTYVIYEKEQDYAEGLEKLAREFRKDYGPDYTEFEKTALLLNGKGAVPILNDLRTLIRWEKPMYDMEKTAERTVVAENDYTKVFSDIYEAKKVQYQYAEGVKIANEKLRTLVNAS